MLKQIQLQYGNGVYSAPIDITTLEWKEMWDNPEIFDEASKKMVLDWYKQPFHQATSKEVMQYNSVSGRTPYNGIVKGLGQRIIKYLNRFEVIDTSGNGKSYSIIPFEGWHVDYNPNKNFVWKVRDELIEAIELDMSDEEKTHRADYEDYDGVEISSDIEGRKVSYYSTKYERSTKNRVAAIKLHGTICSICGFDFEKVYGEHGKGFIEVHHVNPLSKQQREVHIDPASDLICVCSNCHRMIHRRKHDILNPKQLMNIILTAQK